MIETMAIINKLWPISRTHMNENRSGARTVSCDDRPNHHARNINITAPFNHRQVAFSSCESVVVPNVGSHVGYDSRLDALRHSVEYLNFHPPALIRTELQ